MPFIIKPITLSKLPNIISIIFTIMDMMVIIIVTIHAQPLPVNRPQATTKLAIPSTINMPPSTPINPPSMKMVLFGMVTSVPLIFIVTEEFEVLLFSKLT